MMTPIEELANAVVLQAVEDYRGALRTLRKFPDKREAQKKKRSIEAFFYSHWCKVLTGVDMVTVSRTIRKEILGLERK